MLRIDTTSSGPAPAAPSAAVPDLARWPVFALAGVVGVALGVTSARYGYFGDELYFIAAGSRPAFGYADQPPLLPLLAAALDRLAPGSTVVLRLPATAATAGAVVFAALIARELGGRRRAQVVAAGATAICPFLLTTGHLLATATLGPLLWTALLWTFVRWVRLERVGRRDDRLLLLAGLLTAVALQTSFLVIGLLAGLLAGVALVGPRGILARPLLWVGMLAAAGSAVPTLLWQAAHGWPQVRMGAAVAGESALFGNRWEFVPFAVFGAGVLPGVVLLVLGVAALLRRPALAPWRFAGVAVLVTTALMVAAGGRSYYVAGFYVLLLAAGAVALGDRAPGRGWRWTVSVPVFVISGLLVGLTSLPVGPAALRFHDPTVAGQLGWPGLADSVAEAYRTVPLDERAGTVVLASSYVAAGALAHYGPERGLAGVYSPDRGYGYLGVPPDSSARALLVGEFEQAAQLCRELRPLPPHVDPTVGPVAVAGSQDLAVCTPRVPWSLTWPTLRSW